MKDKKYLIISKDAEIIWQDSMLISDKNSQWNGYRRNVPQNSKSHIWQTHS